MVEVYQYSECISNILGWKSWKHSCIPGDSGHQTPTVLNKMVFVDIMQRIIVIADYTHLFQPVPLGSKWNEKVDQLNQLKSVDSQ